MTTDRLGEDLKAVLDDLGADELVLAGHSMGGMTIQALATHHPEVVRDHVRGIVLVATAAQAFPRPVARALLDLALGDVALAPLRRGALSLAVTRGALGRQAHRAHVQATAEAFFGTTAAVRSGFLAAMSAMDYREGLADIGVPTTVLVGTHDRLTPPMPRPASWPSASRRRAGRPPRRRPHAPARGARRVTEAIVERAKVLR